MYYLTVSAMIMESETQTEITPVEETSPPPPLPASAHVVSPPVHKPRPPAPRFTPIPTMSLQERRSSKRSIKRKRFDDEVVESSIPKQELPRKPKGITVKILKNGIFELP